MENINKWSEWRKWDLHVHTPLSIVQNYWWEQKFDEFITSLENLPEDVKVIWINDYYFIDWYKKVMDYKNKWRLQNIEKIFPILEFRIDTFWSASESSFQKVNLHILFNLDEKDLENEINKIQNEFINQIKLSKHHATKILSKENFISESSDKKLKTWFNEIIPSTEEIKKLLLTDTWKNNTFIFLWYIEWNNLNKSTQLKPEKTNLYDFTNAFFTASKDDNLSKKEEVLFWFWNKPLLHSWDIHCFDKLWSNYNCFTWIKADPTFEWLKQIIYEPEERVFIWEKPEVLERVNNNKTKYIKSLKINQINWYNDKNWVWFKNLEIEFNKELIAIIWNKWNWKSAIADILWMIWDTKNYEHFSFLKKDRFHKNWLSKNFNWTIIWEDWTEKSCILRNWTIINNIEKVRYLPQNYFNNLTNELESKDFKITLENVVFNHLDDSLKLWQNSFEELKELKTKNTNNEIDNIKIRLNEKNKEIIKLERQKHTDEKEKVKNQIIEKNKEIEVQQNLLNELKEVKNPSEDDKISEENKNKSNEINKLNLEIKTIDETIENVKKSKLEFEKNKQHLNDFLWFFENIEKQVENYKNENKEKYQNLWLNINEIISVNIKKNEIQDKFKLNQNEIDKLKYKLSNIDDIIFELDEEIINKIKNESLEIKKDDKLKQIQKIKEWLTQQEKEYQNYIEEKHKINKKIEEINWNENDINSLEYYKNILKFVDEKVEEWKTRLEIKLEKLKKERLELSIAIYKQKQEIINLYKEFKKPIDKKVEENKSFLNTENQINVDAKFFIKPDFNKKFLNFINQSRSWTFSWKIEWEQKLIEIYDSKNLQNEEDIREILNNYINTLYIDINNWEKRDIFKQVDSLEEFYNYVFSLDYIDTEFELKSWDKPLEQLSPWEKWTLLLIFYLMIDEEWIPLIIDQPEDNLDNQSIFNMLSNFIRKAKKKRQIIIVTHNPNLAIWADAEQIIYVDIDKSNNNTFSFKSGSIENTEINNHTVDILEWTMKAFNKRKLKYI